MEEQQDKFTFDRFALFFILLLLLAGVTLLLFLNPMEFATGKLHEAFPSMLRGGSSIANSQFLKLLSFLYGFIIFCLLINAVYIGGRKSQKFAGFKYMILVFTIVYLAAYAIMMFSYWKYIEGNNSYFLGFPVPSAWMIYAIHLFPFLLLIFYAVNFHKYIISRKEINNFIKNVKNN